MKARMRLATVATIVAVILSGCYLAVFLTNVEHIGQGFAALIQGLLGQGYALPDEPAAPTDTRVTHVWAVPLRGGSGGTWVNNTFFEFTGAGLDAGIVRYWRSFPVERRLDGVVDFQVDLDALKDLSFQGGEEYGGDWLLVFADERNYADPSIDEDPAVYPALTAARRDVLLSYVGISDPVIGAGASLIRLPVESTPATVDLDLGAVSRSGDGSEGLSASTLEAQMAGLGLPLSTLRQVARTDNVYKHLKNVFINHRFNAILSYVWAADGAAGFFGMDSAAGRGPGDYRFGGIKANVQHGWTRFSEVTTGPVRMLVPGDLVVLEADGVTETTLAAGDYMDDYAILEPQPAPAAQTWSFENRMTMVSAPPPGWFELQRVETASGQWVTWGYWDYSLLDPFVDAEPGVRATDDPVTVYVPVPTLVTEDDGGRDKLVGIAVAWYLWDAGSYRQLTAAELRRMLEFEIDSAEALPDGYPNPGELVIPGYDRVDFSAAIMGGSGVEGDRHTERYFFPLSTTADTLVPQGTDTARAAWYLPASQADLDGVDLPDGYAWIDTVTVNYMFAGALFSFLHLPVPFVPVSAP